MLTASSFPSGALGGSKTPKSEQLLTAKVRAKRPFEVKGGFSAMPAPKSFIYILYSSGRLKIGTTIDPQARVEGLRSSSATAVSLIWLGRGDRDDERALHKRFAKDRLQGEWFYPSDDLRAFIAEKPAPSIGAETPAQRLAWAEANPDQNLGPP